MKIILDNLITENEKNQKEIENILNNSIISNNNINNKKKWYKCIKYKTKL